LANTLAARNAQAPPDFVKSFPMSSVVGIETDRVGKHIEVGHRKPLIDLLHSGEDRGPQAVSVDGSPLRLAQALRPVQWTPKAPSLIDAYSPFTVQLPIDS